MKSCASWVAIWLALLVKSFRQLMAITCLGMLALISHLRAIVSSLPELKIPRRTWSYSRKMKRYTKRGSWTGSFYQASTPLNRQRSMTCPIQGHLRRLYKRSSSFSRCLRVRTENIFVMSRKTILVFARPTDNSYKQFFMMLLLKRSTGIHQFKPSLN